MYHYFRAPETYRNGQARFGSEPSDYNAQSAAFTAARTVPPVQPAAPTAIPAPSQPMPMVLSAVQSAPTPPITVQMPQPPPGMIAGKAGTTMAAQGIRENERKDELTRLQSHFKQAVADYCKARNAQTKRLDALRELRGKVEEEASLIDEGKCYV